MRLLKIEELSDQMIIDTYKMHYDRNFDFKKQEYCTGTPDHILKGQQIMLAESEKRGIRNKLEGEIL